MTEQKTPIELLPCPFCGAKAEVHSAFKPTIEESLAAEPDITCSEMGCAGRHVGASLKEWQHRETELQAMTAERDQLRTQLEAWHHVFGTSQLTHAEAKLTAALAAIKRRDEVIKELVVSAARGGNCPQPNKCGPVCKDCWSEWVAAKLKGE